MNLSKPVSAARMGSLPIPTGHVGLFVIPATGRRVWWTGRVAIGLFHEPEPHPERIEPSSLWLQRLMLDEPLKAAVDDGERRMHH